MKKYFVRETAITKDNGTIYHHIIGKGTRVLTDGWYPCDRGWSRRYWAEKYIAEDKEYMEKYPNEYYIHEYEIIEREYE